MRDTRDMFDPPERGRFGDNESIRGNDSVRANLCDLDLVLHYETPKAILVSSDGKEARASWLPKYAVEIHRGALTTRGTKKSGQLVTLPIITVAMPERLAKEKGLL